MDQDHGRPARAVRAPAQADPTTPCCSGRCELSDRYLGGLATPESVRWVDNQNSRWGSCTPGDRTIRLSARLQGMPQWVIDYVLIHELAHLLEPGHDAKFWSWVDRYPKAERAKGYLLGWSAAAHVESPPGATTTSTDPRGHAALAPARPARPGPAPGRAARRPATSARPATRR